MRVRSVIYLAPVQRPAEEPRGQTRFRRPAPSRGSTMTDARTPSGFLTSSVSRRNALKGLGAAAALGTAPGFVRYAQAQSSAPIRIGFQAHRTGIGASYGRWYERTTAAAVKAINEAGGINGRPVEIIDRKSTRLNSSHVKIS